MKILCKFVTVSLLIRGSPLNPPKGDLKTVFFAGSSFSWPFCMGKDQNEPIYLPHCQEKVPRRGIEGAAFGDR